MLKIFLSLIFLFSFSVSAHAPLQWSGNMYKIINKFERIHTDYTRKVCQPGDSQKYYQLLKDYRGQGYWLPKYEDHIDRRAIKKHLPFLKKKITYLKKMRADVSKLEELPNFMALFGEIEKVVDQLLILKKEHHQALTKESKIKLEKKSALKLLVLKKAYKRFIDKFFFLKSYNFPNDYLENRKQFEALKNQSSAQSKRLANAVFFYRKITEDGAMDSNHTRSDKYLRTTLDTLYLAINSQKGFISENVRYDLNWIRNKIERLVKRGKKIQLERILEWEERTEETYTFYKNIIKSKNRKKADFLIKKENEATHKLKDFVYKKQAETYEFWSKQPELYKALYTLESILVNEVGVIDGKYGLERTGVAYVVFNRVKDKFYSQLNEGQWITKYLPKDLDTKKELWLNTLFKTGEFSFTYHYISGVVHTFCADMSKRGKNIRKKNLKIALKAAKSYHPDFNAYRYFSRVSMLGKIDMSSVWGDNYYPLPEMPGYKAYKQRKLSSLYNANKYKYFYSFKDSKNIEYNVVKIDGKTYAMKWYRGKPEFYDYRNPHYFTYFSKKN